MTQEAKIIAGISLVTIAIVVGAVFFFGRTTPQSATPLAEKASPEQLVKEDSQNITTPGAKVTIVEFLDYECEACGAAHPVVKQVLDSYKGKVNFVVRNFPNHYNSVLAANAAEAAGEQGKYWEMHNLLFEKQREWGEKQEPQTEIFTAYAQELGLDIDKFTSVLKNGKYTEKIIRDKDEGIALGVNATPTFYINGTQYVGVFSFEQFKEIINDLNK